MECILASQSIGAVERRTISEVEELLRDLRPWLYRLALAITVQPELAEDAAQDALLRAAKAKRTLQHVDEPRAWLRKTTVRCALNAIAKPAKPSPTGEAIHQDPTESIAVRQTLARMDSGDRVVLALTHFEELSYAEIAAILDIPSGTVGSRLHSAREAFRKEWCK